MGRIGTWGCLSPSRHASARDVLYPPRMKRWVSPIGVLGAMVFCATASTAGASLVAALDMETLVQRADRIGVVRVVGQASRYDDRQRIVTDVMLETEEGVAGLEAGQRFELVVIGGDIGDLGMRIAGEPSFRTGERALVFVRRWGARWRPVGMSQGAMPISRIAGHDLVSPGGAGLALVRRERDGRLSHASGALERPTALPAVLDRVRSLLER